MQIGFHCSSVSEGVGDFVKITGDHTKRRLNVVLLSFGVGELAESEGNRTIAKIESRNAALQEPSSC